MAGRLGATHDPLGLGLALLERVLVLELRSHFDGIYVLVWFGLVSTEDVVVVVV